MHDKSVAGDQLYVKGAFPEAGVPPPSETGAPAHLVRFGPAFALHCAKL